MRNKLYHILSIGGILILLGAASAFAQSTLKASIPFSFKVDQAALPAGDYTITLLRDENWGGVVLLKNADTKTWIKTFVVDGSRKRLQDHAYLVFNSYADQHFLSQIWSASANAGTELPKSRSEREVMRSSPQGQVNKGVPPKLVTIAISPATSATEAIKSN
jgi:hypothetical protein